MARYSIKMPDVGEGITEAEIVEWAVSVGDFVQEDDILAAVMTDKATVEIPSPVTGTIVGLHGDLGETTAVGAKIITMEVDGSGAAKEGRPVDEAGHTEMVPPNLSTAPEQVEKPLASPPVRRRAKAAGIELGAVTGTGPEGRTHA